MIAPILGIVLAKDVTVSFDMSVLGISCFDGAGEGVLVLEPPVRAGRLWCCESGDGFMRRGSIFDIGGVDEGLLF